MPPLRCDVASAGWYRKMFEFDPNGKSNCITERQGCLLNPRHPKRLKLTLRLNNKNDLDENQGRFYCKFQKIVVKYFYKLPQFQLRRSKKCPN